LAVLLAAVLLFAGCDAIKGLLGEDSGPDGGGGSGSGGVSVSFEEIDVAGGETTTLVTLVFDKDIPGLSDRDVTITDAGDTGAVAGVLSPTEAAGAYTLAVSGVKETEPITIAVGKSGYTVTPATQKAVVNFDETANKVTFVGAIADGAAGSQTTTALILTFNATFATPFQPGDITLWPGSTGAAMGNLSPGGDGAFSLQVSGITAEGDVYVTVVKDDYTVRPATVPVTVHYLAPGPATGGDVTPFSGFTADPGDSAIDKIRAPPPGTSSLNLTLIPGAEEVVSLDGNSDLGTGLVLDNTNSPAQVTIDGQGRTVRLDANSPNGRLINVGVGGNADPDEHHPGGQKQHSPPYPGGRKRRDARPWNRRGYQGQP
jgi:hypothetical protein